MALALLAFRADCKALDWQDSIPAGPSCAWTAANHPGATGGARVGTYPKMELPQNKIGQSGRSGTLPSLKRGTVATKVNVVVEPAIESGSRQEVGSQKAEWVRARANSRDLPRVFMGLRPTKVDEKRGYRVP
jgi:hypothetical protein